MVLTLRNVYGEYRFPSQRKEVIAKPQYNIHVRRRKICHTFLRIGAIRHTNNLK